MNNIKFYSKYIVFVNMKNKQSYLDIKINSIRALFLNKDLIDSMRDWKNFLLFNFSEKVNPQN